MVRIAQLTAGTRRIHYTFVRSGSGQQYLSKQLAHTPSLSFPDLSLARSTTAQARQAGHILSTPIESDFPWGGNLP